MRSHHLCQLVASCGETHATSAVSAATDPASISSLPWSIVVIARNEEAVIGACLESVMTAFAARPHELIVVDSASTDGTAQIAAGFPGRVIRLPETMPLRPSVGRHVGLRHCRGRWILFLDGDMTLMAQWVEDAERALSADSRLAGVAGDMEHSLRTAGSGRTSFRQTYPPSDYIAADFLAGAAAYTREALEQAGGFNPFLRAAEEAELGARLRKSGFRLRRLRTPMTQHFAKHPGETVPELLRRIRRGFFIGLGQFARYSYSQKLPARRPLAPILRHIEFFSLLLLGLAAALAAALNRDWRILLAWLAAMAVIFLLFAVRSRSMFKPAYYFLEWALASPLVIRGLLERPHSIDEFRDV